MEDIRHRPYQLLDFEATQFDRDFLEFNVHIHDLELTLQVCIRAGYTLAKSASRYLALGRRLLRLHTAALIPRISVRTHGIQSANDLKLTLQVHVRAARYSNSA